MVAVNVTTTATLTDEITKQLLPLIAEVDGRKLGVCPECFAGPIWSGLWEYSDHVEKCVRIRLGAERARLFAEAQQ